MEVLFSTLSRGEYINELKETAFDVLVIGGGITGAGIALDAVSRGLKTALVEKVDFAWGTSSRSTKLVHGGLRYLKQFEFGLVHEVGKERAIVYKNAPHIVIPEKMLLPIIEGGALGKRMSSIGLWVYDYLANVEREERRKMLEANEVANLEPLLRTDILQGGGLYYEYRTDDARLAVEIIKTAVAKGAVCLNYAEVTGFEENADGQLSAACITDHKRGEQFSIRAKKIVNAGGPWVDTLRGMDKEGVQRKRLHLTKGVHLVIPRDRLPLEQSVYFDVMADNRMCFAIPRGNITYVGTTDTFYDKKIDSPVATKQDVDYILKAVNDMFPSAELTINDVESSWAGLRPLIHQEGKAPSELSRKDELFFSSSGLISIAGGKLTGYRKMAERTVNAVCKQLKLSKKCQTEQLTLGGGSFINERDLFRFIETSHGEAKQVGATKVMIAELVYRYGRATSMIIDKAYELFSVYQNPVETMQAAEIWYTIHYEMTTNLNDYLIRRTGRLYFERPWIQHNISFVAKVFGEYLAWSQEDLENQLASFDKEYHAVMDFK